MLPERELASPKAMTEGCACIAIPISSRNPSVYSQMLVATSPFRGDIVGSTEDYSSQFANFYMLPERELASPKAMTEGCVSVKDAIGHIPINIQKILHFYDRHILKNLL